MIVGSMKDFFGDTPYPAPLPPTEQIEQIQRVRSNIGKLIVGFFEERGIGAQFHADDLRKHVTGDATTAPASSDRIMRDLRKSGFINYEVVNRSKSLYRIVAIENTFP